MDRQGLKAHIFSIVYGTTKSRALIQSPVLMLTLKPVWNRRLRTPGLKPALYLPERSRGLECPFPGLKSGASTNSPRTRIPMQASFRERSTRIMNFVG
jgi:hypothetical protein